MACKEGSKPDPVINGQAEGAERKTSKYAQILGNGSLKRFIRLLCEKRIVEPALKPSRYS